MEIYAAFPSGDFHVRSEVHAHLGKRFDEFKRALLARFNYLPLFKVNDVQEETRMRAGNILMIKVDDQDRVSLHL